MLVGHAAESTEGLLMRQTLSLYYWDGKYGIRDNYKLRQL